MFNQYNPVVRILLLILIVAGFCLGYLRAIIQDVIVALYTSLWPGSPRNWLKPKELNKICKNLNNEQLKVLTNFFGSNEQRRFENAFSLVHEHVANNLPKADKYVKIEKHQKNEMTAVFGRVMGKIAEPNIDSAVWFYNNSLAYELPNSCELPALYYNKAEILLHMNCLEEALEVSDIALRCRCAVFTRIELLVLQGFCYERLSSKCYDEAQCWLNRAPTDNLGEKKMVVDILKTHSSPVPKEKPSDFTHDPNWRKGECPKLRSRNSKYPCASGAIDVRYSEKFGRHIVATRDIEIGDVLVIEEPYIAFPRPSERHSVCSHCLMDTTAGIACGSCVNAIYCSRKCQEIAWCKYHYMDCLFYDLMSQYDCAETAGQYARIFFQMYSEAGGLRKLKKRVANFDKYKNLEKWPLGERCYRNTSLERILAMMTHAKEIPVERLRETALCALRIVFILATETPCFGKRYKREKLKDPDILRLMSFSEDINFVGGLLMRIGLVTRHNNYQVTDMYTGNRRGYVTLPFFSLFNHSCFPNTQRLFKGGKLCLYAAVPIKKGEQIFDCYGARFSEKPKKDRIMDIEKRFYFTCTCDACKEDWPLMKVMEKRHEDCKSIFHNIVINEMLPGLQKIHDHMRNVKSAYRKNDLKRLHGYLGILYDGVLKPSISMEVVFDDITIAHYKRGRLYTIQMNKTS